MNYFVEGLQGSGKSTLARKIAEKRPEFVLKEEGDYSPVELAWCAYMNGEQYQAILEKYPEMRKEIEEKTHTEGEKKIVCYTKIRTENRGFYQDLEQYEIYNNRVSWEEFQDIVLRRYRNWNQDKMIFECSLFQNTVEDMILFRNASDEGIIAFYRKVREALEGKEYCIVLLQAEDVRDNLAVIRKERSDEQGNELWFPMMMQYFNECPYAKARGLEGEEALIRHFIHRQELEMRLCKEVFADRYRVLKSKKYGEKDILYLLMNT